MYTHIESVQRANELTDAANMRVDPLQALAQTEKQQGRTVSQNDVLETVQFIDELSLVKLLTVCWKRRPNAC